MATDTKVHMKQMPVNKFIHTENIYTHWQLSTTCLEIKQWISFSFFSNIHEIQCPRATPERGLMNAIGV